MLSGIEAISAVSGGSIAATHLVLNWERYVGCDEDFEAAVSELLAFAKRDVRGRIARRLIPAGFNTIGLLEKEYARLYGSCKMENLRIEGSSRPHLLIATTELKQAAIYSFSDQGMYAFHRNGKTDLIESTSTEVATAVAASSAFPGFFRPLKLRPRDLGVTQEILRVPELHLTDGGVFDNLGLRQLKRSPFFDATKSVLCSDAGALVDWTIERRFVFFNAMARCAEILTERVRNLEIRSASRVRYVRIHETTNHDLAPDATLQNLLPSIRTDLDRFSELEAAYLICHGYCVGWDVLSENPPNPAPFLLREIEKDPQHRRHNVQKRHLQKAAVRKRRLFSLTDWVSYVPSIVAVAAIGLIYSNWPPPPIDRLFSERMRHLGRDAQMGFASGADIEYGGEWHARWFDHNAAPYLGGKADGPMRVYDARDGQLWAMASDSSTGSKYWLEGRVEPNVGHGQVITLTYWSQKGSNLSGVIYLEAQRMDGKVQTDTLKGEWIGYSRGRKKQNGQVEWHRR